MTGEHSLGHNQMHRLYLECGHGKWQPVICDAWTVLGPKDHSSIGKWDAGRLQ